MTYTLYVCFFFFNDPATTEIYTLSLHDALPIWWSASESFPARRSGAQGGAGPRRNGARRPPATSRRAPRRSIARPRAARAKSDRKSTRLNSSHTVISYAVFCLKKKKYE